MKRDELVLGVAGGPGHAVVSGRSLGGQLRALWRSAAKDRERSQRADATWVSSGVRDDGDRVRSGAWVS